MTRVSIVFRCTRARGDEHERLIDEFGGSSSNRDRGMLESALFRPQTGYYENLLPWIRSILIRIVD
jgi:hypothetical protein